MEQVALNRAKLALGFRCAVILGLVLTLAGCALPWNSSPTLTAQSRSSGIKTTTAPRAAAAVRAAAGSAAAARAWLSGGQRSVSQILSMLSSLSPNSTASTVFVEALATRCSASVPAAAARIAELGRGLHADGWVAEALGEVLARCPAPRGAVAGRVADDLLRYLRSPLAEPWGPGFQQTVRKDLPVARLQAALSGMSRGGVMLSVQALSANSAALFSDLAANQRDAAGRAIANAAGALPAGTVERWFESPRITDRAVRVRLLAAISPSPRPAYETWLKQAAVREKDPAVAELLWSRLYLTDGDPAALTSLNRLADRYGTFRLDPYRVNVWNWRVLRPAAAADPSGFLARGIRAYEAVEAGRPYFAVDRCPPSHPCWPFLYGNRQFDPAREIPGWKAFLKRFAGHPAATDAAYRLARCEEILGHWSEALRYLYRAADVYPDGQLAYAARGRLVFLLDVEIPLDGLRTLAQHPPNPSLAPAIRYALAVRELRHGEYARAASDLAASPPPDLRLTPWLPWPAAARAELQRAEAKQLAGLARQAFRGRWSPIPPSGGASGPRADFAPAPGIADPKAAYELAALLFHHNLLLYDEMWGGDQQGFFAFHGDINALVDGGLSPGWVRQLRAMNGYVEAEPVFAAVAADPSAPATLRAKALYSQGEALVHLDGYNEATDVTMQKSVLRWQIVRLFRAFAARYPHAGALTRDALLTVARYTRTAADVAAVEQAAPGSWQAKTARALLTPHPGTVMAGRPLGDLGFQRMHTGGVASGSGQGSRVGIDRWTTIRLAPQHLPPNAGVQIVRVADRGRGGARVDWRVVPAGQQPDLPWAAAGPVEVVRVPAVLHDVTFKELTWP